MYFKSTQHVTWKVPQCMFKTKESRFWGLNCSSASAEVSSSESYFSMSDLFPKALLCFMVLRHSYVKAIQYATTKPFHCKVNQWRTTVVFNTVHVFVLNHMNPFKWQWEIQNYPQVPNEDVSVSLVLKRERGERTAKRGFPAASPRGLPPAKTLNLA